MMLSLLYSYRATIALSILSIAMLVFRIGVLTEGPCDEWLSLPICSKLRHAFLVWNLFLAWVPIFLLELIGQPAKTNLIRWIAIGTAILFFPNAPYLITDLIHLRAQKGVPIWFDALMLFSFAYLGVVLSLRTLRQIHNLVDQNNSPNLANTIIGTTLILSGIGIYLGRVLRWNSWDAFLYPTKLINDTLQLLFNPIQNQEAWLMIILFSSFIACIYWVWLNDIKIKSPGA